MTSDTAAIRSRTLIVNLAGQPEAIAEGFDVVSPATPYRIELNGGASIHMEQERLPGCRPKSARRSPT